MAKFVSLDPVGASLVVGSLTCFVLAMDRGNWQGWRTITSLSASAVLIALFVINEWLMGSRAMIQGELLKNRNIITNLLYIFFLAGLFFPLTYTLSIQFQSVGNASATQSGIKLIPLILGVSIFTLVANGLLTFWRRLGVPLLVFGAISGTAGTALVHSLGADASFATWVGYEAIIGMGVGMALQIPMIANQAAVGVEDMAAVTALTLFVENVGTVLFIAATEAAFTSGLVKALGEYAPYLSPGTVLNAGATGIRTSFTPKQVTDVLRSYLQACQDSQFVPIACGGLAILVSMSLGFPEIVKEVNARVRKHT